MDNVFIKTDPVGNIKMDKEKYTEGIDGAVVLVMVLDRSISCSETKKDYVYNSRSIIIS